MIKKLSVIVLLLGLLCYFVAAVTVLNKPEEGQVCGGVEVVVEDSLRVGFIQPDEVLRLLDKQKCNPVGRKMNEVALGKMEAALRKNPYIEDVTCYKTPGGNVCVEVSQRIPILRVMSDNGDNYYVDNKGIIMPHNAKCVAHLAIASGNIEKTFATNELYKFGLFLQNNAFWSAQIEQVHVLPDKTVELVPRVGDHIIFLGKLKGYERKLERVKKFYERALNHIGWNKYSRINVEFDNQIICTRR